MGTAIYIECMCELQWWCLVLASDVTLRVQLCCRCCWSFFHQSSHRVALSDPSPHHINVDYIDVLPLPGFEWRTQACLFKTFNSVSFVDPWTLWKLLWCTSTQVVPLDGKSHCNIQAGHLISIFDVSDSKCQVISWPKKLPTPQASAHFLPWPYPLPLAKGFWHFQQLPCSHRLWPQVLPL